MFQEDKARQIFRKTNISYPLIRTRDGIIGHFLEIHDGKTQHILFTVWQGIYTSFCEMSISHIGKLCKIKLLNHNCDFPDNKIIYQN